MTYFEIRERLAIIRLMLCRHLYSVDIEMVRLEIEEMFEQPEGCVPADADVLAQEIVNVSVRIAPMVHPSAAVVLDELVGQDSILPLLSPYPGWAICHWMKGGNSFIIAHESHCLAALQAMLANRPTTPVMLEPTANLH